jgi:hypothetical protein
MRIAVMGKEILTSSGQHYVLMAEKDHDKERLEFFT